jgi:hypothetical protein
VTANPTSLHITIVAGSIGRHGALDLSQETRLVKAALLYADRVTLANPKMMIIASMAGIIPGNLEHRRAAVLGMMNVLPEGEATRAVYEELRHKRRKSVREMLVLRGLVERLDRGAEQAVAQVESMLEEAGAGELDEALRAGVVDLNHLGLNESDPGLARVTLWLADLIVEMVALSSPRYPMFDDAPDGLLATMIREGRAPGARLAGAAQPALASRLIGRLDAFPDAPMSAVLEARRTLDAPLVRLRLAIAKMQAELETIPLDEDFDRAVRDTYEKRIVPALEELQDVARQLRTATLLGREFRSPRIARTGDEAAISIVTATVAELPGLAALALGIGLDLGASSVYKRRSELKERQTENRLSFLYEAGANDAGAKHAG